MPDQEKTEAPETDHDDSESPQSLMHYMAEQVHRYDVFPRAAQLAYYQLFSLFPILLFIGILLSLLPMPNLWESLLEYLRGVLPPQAFSLVVGTLANASKRRPHELLSVSLLALIWSSSTWMEALISSLNAAYHAHASRGWWRERVLAILLTIGMTTFILISLTVVFFGTTIINIIADHNAYGETFRIAWQTGQWPVVAAFVLIGLDLVYFVAPNVKQPWRWVSPGSAIAVGAWLLISLGLKIYVSRISDYNVTYGVLGSFMILMLWIYLTSAAILLGGVINGALLTRTGKQVEKTAEELVAGD